MTLPAPRLFDLSQDQRLHEQIAQIHMDCIAHDHQLLSFLPPLDYDKMLRYWQQRTKAIETDGLAVILQMADGSNGQEEVAGSVCLRMPFSETGPFRGWVEQLIVSPRHRRKGIARRMMEKVEDVARKNHRELLLLDTTIGTPAEHVYPKLGYTECGIIPKYGISPKDGSLVDEKFFYKDLRDHSS